METNFEHYKNDLLYVGESFGVGMRTGVIMPCRESEISNCENCLFAIRTESCAELRVRWLMQAYDVNDSLNDCERAILSNMRDGYLHRLENGNLEWLEDEPTYHDDLDIWYTLHKSKYAIIGTWILYPKRFFGFITHENHDLYRVKDGKLSPVRTRFSSKNQD